jgi:hypothetical protein
MEDRRLGLQRASARDRIGLWNVHDAKLWYSTGYLIATAGDAHYPRFAATVRQDLFAERAFTSESVCGTPMRLAEKVNVVHHVSKVIQGDVDVER